MFENADNTRKQGDIGLGCAIRRFTILGHTVAVPLTDSQPYDLLVDVGDKIHRVQVKSTRFKKRGGSFYVSLTLKGGNRSGRTITAFDKTLVDSVYIVTGDGVEYWIPVEKMKSNNTISLGKFYDEFIIGR